MANFAYTRAKATELGAGLGSSLGLLGLRQTYTPVASASHHTVADVAAYELTAAGYARAFVTATVTEDDPNGRAVLAGTAGTYSLGAAAAGQTLAWVVLYKRGASDALSDLICAYDVTDTPTDGTAITLTPNAGGLYRIT